MINSMVQHHDGTIKAMHDVYQNVRPEQIALMKMFYMYLKEIEKEHKVFAEWPCASGKCHTRPGVV